MAKRGVLTHRKTRDLARELDVDLAVALGYLEALWHATAEIRPRGDIGTLADADIAAEMWVERVEPTRLIEALKDAGWLDEHPEFRLVVHGWSEHADKHVRWRLRRANLTFWDGADPLPRRKVEAPHA